jgi:hypothetical protein
MNKVNIAVYDPKVSGKKVLADLDYLETINLKNKKGIVSSLKSLF